MTPIVFVAGLPRSGSTLLLSLLAQNPEHAVTSTNGLVDMLALIRDAWPRNESFLSQGLTSVKPRMVSALRQMLIGYHAEELKEGRTVFNKARAWVAQIDVLEEVLGEKVRILYPIRDIRSIVASFEKLYRRHPLTRPSYVEAPEDGKTIEGRVRQLMGPGTAVSAPIEMLREALARGFGDRLLFVPYRDLTCNTAGTLRNIHEALDLPSFAYSRQVKQVTSENDDRWGFPDLHHVASTITPEIDAPWENVLPKRVAAALNEQYADIQQLV